MINNIVEIADMTIYDTSGQVVALVEVKNKFGTSREWATKMRRNIAAHGLLPDAKYFLLALPDHFYLWKGVTPQPGEIAPTYDINPEPFLKPYYEKIGIAPEQLSGKSFKLIMTSWLGELQQAKSIPTHLPRETQQWLQESGLLEAIKDGRISYEDAA